MVFDDGREVQVDGAWTNAVTGMGAAPDKDSYTRISGGAYRPRHRELAELYVMDGTVRRIARTPAEKALKDPVTIDGDEGGETYEALSRMGFFEKVVDAGSFARLHGGAVMVTLYEGDGESPEKLRSAPGPREKVAAWRVYTPYEAELLDSDFDRDPRSPRFGEPAWFPLRLRDGGFLRLHWSRVAVFHGARLPGAMDFDASTGFYGASDVVPALDAVRRIPGAMAAASNLMQRNGTMVFHVSGLGQIEQMEDGARIVANRFSEITSRMGSMRAIMLDGSDSFESVTTSLSGIPEILKQLYAHVSSVTGIPVSVLFGDTVTGLSSTNEGDLRQMDELVERWRQSCLYRPMCAMMTDYRNRNEGVAGPCTFQFGSVSQPTDRERAEIFEKRANALRTLYDIGAITAAEVRENLLVNGGNAEISVEAGAPGGGAELPTAEELAARREGPGRA